MASASGIALWWAPLDVCAADRGRLERSLSPGERHRADRLRRPLDRRRFVAARGWLRLVLGRRTGIVPSAVELVAGAGGKPRLDGAELHFNAARSAGVALFALSPDQEVGVDLEAHRDLPEVDGIVARFCAPAERRSLARLPRAEREAACFASWVRKEAYVKGTGAGVCTPLQAVDVWGDGRRHVRSGGWSIHQVDVAPGFAAAVAWAGDGPPPGPPRELRLPDVARPGRRRADGRAGR